MPITFALSPARADHTIPAMSTGVTRVRALNGHRLTDILLLEAAILVVILDRVLRHLRLATHLLHLYRPWTNLSVRLTIPNTRVAAHARGARLLVR